MAAEDSGKGELSELVTDHVLCHEDIHERLAVVDLEGDADELGNDGARAPPSLDGLAPTAGLKSLNLSEEFLIECGTFLE